MKFESKYHSLVVNFNDVILNDLEVMKCLDNRFHDASFIGILHDEDYVGDLKKRPHVHVYLEFSKKIKTQAIITEFMEYFNNYSIEKIENAISDKKVFSKNKCIRYLLHLDNVDKHQYMVGQLFYNDKSLLDYLDVLSDIDYSYLQQIVDDSRSICEVYSKIGDLSLCSRYRSIIIDMFYDNGIFKKAKYETSK